VRRGQLALAAAGLGLGYAAERLAVEGSRRWPDPAAGDDFSPLDDAVLHGLPTDDGGEAHVLERGSGRPLVLLHGITLSTVTWHYQLVDLADRYRVVAVDHRGHGRSRMGSDGCTLELLARDLAGVLDALDLRQVVLVGHSLGGMTLMRFLVDHPEVRDQRVAGVVLLATAPAGVVPLFGKVLTARAVAPLTRGGARYAGRLPGRHLPSNDLSFVLTRLAALGRSASPTHVELTRAMTAATPPSIVVELGESLVGFDVRDGLSDVKLPALVVVGTHDRITPPKRSEEIARLLPGAELVVLPGAGHMPMFERRAELGDLLDRFVQGLP